jgi:hypothetical protein
MSTEVDADDLVTEEMVSVAGEAYDAYRDKRTGRGCEAHGWECIQAALRAVAPLIAERVRSMPYQPIVTAGMLDGVLPAKPGGLREAIAAMWETEEAAARMWEAEDIAAAIRGRGETPTKAPGEIDWSAMDKED